MDFFLHYSKDPNEVSVEFYKSTQNYKNPTNIEYWHSYASKTLSGFLFSIWRNDGAGREKSVVEEINWFSLFDCVGIKTQSCSPSARLRLTACTMGNTFSSQQDSEEKNRRNGKEDE